MKTKKWKCRHCNYTTEMCICGFNDSHYEIARRGGLRSKLKGADYAALGKLGGKAGKGKKKPRLLQNKS